MGLDAATEALRWGVNDLGGTLMEESISRMAGADHGVKLEPDDLVGAAHRAGRPAAERTTLYGIRRRYELVRRRLTWRGSCSARCCGTPANDEARCGCETDAPCAVEVVPGGRARADVRRRRATTTRSSTSPGCRRTAPRRTRSALDGETRVAAAGQPVPAQRPAHPRARRAGADRVRLLPRRRAARAAVHAAQGRGPARARGRRAARPGAADGRARRPRRGRTRCCMLGDQVYADEVHPDVQERLAGERGRPTSTTTCSSTAPPGASR